jgi:formylglycine-generating enzyme required for sulfatase activity
VKKKRNDYDFFISYRSESSTETAQLLCDCLVKFGYNVFFDHTSLTEGDFDVSLEDAVKSSKYFIPILSKGCFSKKYKAGEEDWFRKEISWALSYHLSIVPIIKEGFKIPKRGVLPDDIAPVVKKHAVDYLTTDVSYVVKKILSVLGEPVAIVSENEIEEQSVDMLANKRVKGSAWWIGIVVLLLIFTFGGYKFYESLKLKESVVLYQPVVIDNNQVMEDVRLQKKVIGSIVSDGFVDKKRIQAEAEKLNLTKYLNKSYADAQTAYEAVCGLDKTEGFDVKFQMLELDWQQAESYRHNGDADKAVKMYNQVLSSCESLEELEEARDLAKKQRSVAIKSKDNAIESQSQVDAQKEWNSAEMLAHSANNNFQLGNFRVAADKWEKASREYMASKIQSLGNQSGTQSWPSIGKPDEKEKWTVNLDDGVNIELLPVENGSFFMGIRASGVDEDEIVVHKVMLSKPFWIGKYEVTQKQYESVMGDNPSRFIGENNPVERVDWDDAVEFCEKLTEIDKNQNRLPIGYKYTLPTEAQWEFVARGGNRSSGKIRTLGSWNELGWYSDNSGLETHPVGEKQPNALGLYDMVGNVWEWCDDLYGEYDKSRVKDPIGAHSGLKRVLRGGGYGDVAFCCRPTNRAKVSPDARTNELGFRIVLQQTQ